ncbi:MAG: type 2 isopentenyl-diphosphate Delta-isomerase [Candidatus Dormibacteraceae bacterium]
MAEQGQGARTSSRKAEHLRSNLAGPVLGELTTGFEHYRFEHLALPEIDLAEVITRTSFCGRPLAAPLLISCMTGGTPAAAEINKTLARTAQEFGIALGLGSGRALLEDPSAAGFDVRQAAPDVPVLANLGAAQLNLGYGAEDCRRLLRLTGADALVIHLNPLQEALQPEGDPRWAGLLGRIEALCRELRAPVIVKEVGFGLAADVVERLFAAGAAAVDVAGAGGTSWSEVERLRLTGVDAAVALAFRSWGIPTADAIIGARTAAGDGTVIGSGGITGGIEVAKALALGADLAGIAGPFLRAAAAGPEAAADFAEEVIRVLRTAMFAVGARNLAALRAEPRLRRV